MGADMTERAGRIAEIQAANCGLGSLNIDAADELAALKAKLALAMKALRPIAAFWNAYHQQSRMQRADSDMGRN